MTFELGVISTLTGSGNTAGAFYREAHLIFPASMGLVNGKRLCSCLITIIRAGYRGEHKRQKQGNKSQKDFRETFGQHTISTLSHLT